MSIAFNSITQEDYQNFVKGKYIIRVCTFNVNTKFDKNYEYEKWLHSKNNADILAIGLQELYFKLKDIIAPEYLSNVKDSIPEHRNWIDLFCSINIIKENYTLISSKSFAALSLFIFIKKSRIKNKGQPVSQLMVGSLPLGMLGMANKGGLSISFRFEDISFCFINCHFPAGTHNKIKRQHSMQTLMQKLQFHVDGKSKKVNLIEAEYDLVFLFGDLNFRLQHTTVENVTYQVHENNLSAIINLLKSDELIKSRETDALYNCFHEGRIEFFPTYKFFISTNEYNLKRVPSYCDRILWMGSKCVNISYSCHPEITISDHQPVSGDFFVDGSVHTRKILSKLKKTKVLPSIIIENTTIDFGNVYFYRDHFCQTKMENSSSVTVEAIFKIIRSYHAIPSWFTIIPSSFVLQPHTSIIVQFRVFIDSDNVANFNLNNENINCTIVYVSVTNGANTAMKFQGQYHPSLFGIHLEYFQFIERPIGTYQPSEIEHLKLTRSKKSFEIFKLQELLSRVLDLLMPEIRIDENFSALILKDEGEDNHLFELITDIDNLDIRTTLTDVHETKYQFSTYIEALLIFIKSLPQPIIPVAIQIRLATNPNNKSYVLKVLHNLAKTNILLIRRVVNYLHGFIKCPDDVMFMANFVVKCIPPSSPALNDNLVTVLAFLIQKPHML